MTVPQSYIADVSSSLHLKDRLLTKVNKNLYLSKSEIELLKLNHIPYEKCTSLQELLMLVEEELESVDYADEDLEDLSATLAERNYYWFTNK